MSELDATPPMGFDGSAARADAAKTVVVRTLRAAPRVYLSQTHLEALFGPGHKLAAVWSGLVGETLHLERVTVSSGGKREVRARVCTSPVATTRICLPTQALHLLEIRGAPAFGAESNLGA